MLELRIEKGRRVSVAMPTHALSFRDARQQLICSRACLLPIANNN
jgi:hypothetical protein